MKKLIIAIATLSTIFIGCKKEPSKSLTPTPPLTTKKLTYIIDTSKAGYWHLTTRSTEIECDQMAGSTVTKRDTFINWVSIGGSKFQLDVNITYPDSTYKIENDTTAKPFANIYYGILGGFTDTSLSVVGVPPKDYYLEIFNGDTLNNFGH